MVFGKRKQLRESAHKAWVLGGTLAWQSLADEIEASADDGIPLPSSTQRGADTLLRLVRGAPDPIGNVAMEMAASLKQDSAMNAVQKRLAYRQGVMAAAALMGTERNLDVALEMEARLLGLDEV